MLVQSDMHTYRVESSVSNVSLSSQPMMSERKLSEFISNDASMSTNICRMRTLPTNLDTS